MMNQFPTIQAIFKRHHMMFVLSILSNNRFLQIKLLCFILQRCYFWESRTGLWRSEIAAGPGVGDTDFILYVATLSTDRCRKARTIAYAAHCQQEAALDR